MKQRIVGALIEVIFYLATEATRPSAKSLVSDKTGFY